MSSHCDQFALGADLENQKLKLQKMYHLFETMKFGGGTKKFHIQRHVQCARRNNERCKTVEKMSNVMDKSE